MTKRLASKHKVDRRLKVNLWGRPKSPFNTRNYKPGQHGKSSRGKTSDFGTQLQAKQRLKFYYGNMNERQFRNVFRKALQKRGNTTENFIGLLERRLDTVIYRAKFAITIFSARQLINHGHVKVNGKKVNIASYLIDEKDTIEIKDKSKELIVIAGAFLLFNLGFEPFVAQVERLAGIGLGGLVNIGLGLGAIGLGLVGLAAGMIAFSLANIFIFDSDWEMFFKIIETLGTALGGIAPESAEALATVFGMS